MHFPKPHRVQVTRWEYGTTLEDSAAAAELASLFRARGQVARVAAMLSLAVKQAQGDTAIRKEWSQRQAQWTRLLPR